MIPMSWDWAPHWALCWAQSLLGILSVPLPLSLARTCAVSLKRMTFNNIDHWHFVSLFCNNWLQVGQVWNRISDFKFTDVGGGYHFQNASHFLERLGLGGCWSASWCHEGTLTLQAGFGVSGKLIGVMSERKSEKGTENKLGQFHNFAKIRSCSLFSSISCPLPAFKVLRFRFPGCCCHCPWF